MQTLDDAELVAQAEGGDDEALLSLLAGELADAVEYTAAAVDEDRARALDYYLRRPMGDEREGRSKTISGEVFKVVEGSATAIANIYATAKDAVEFVPRRQDDEEKAKQRTATVNYVFQTQNNGFIAMLEAIKDGMLSKTGYLTWRWQREKRVTLERYTAQTEESLALLLRDKTHAEVVAQNPAGVVFDASGQPQAVFDVAVKITNAAGRVVVESVPPEEVFVSPRTRSADIQAAPVVHWVTYKTRAELLTCGYAAELVERVPVGSGSSRGSITRESDDIGRETEAEIRTTWLRIDTDGDGAEELRRIVWADGVVLSNEMTAEINLSAWTPNIQPHEFFGRCPADEATEGQEVMTAVKRQVLDNLYLTNNPMWRVDPNDSQVNIEDFYNMEIGRPVRAGKDQAEPMVFPFVGQHSMLILEYEQADQENRTGWTRYASGSDGASLNKTARGMTILANASQQRIQLMARMFGETCLKPCMRGIARLLSQYGERDMAFRLNGSFVQVDPREWNEEFDMSVNVGLGMIDQEQRIAHLQSIAQAQAQAMQAGLAGVLVTPQHLFAVQSKIVEAAGFKEASFAWLDPAQAQPKPPAPDPEQTKQAAETERAKIKAQSEIDKAIAVEQIRLQGAQQQAAQAFEIETWRRNQDLGAQEMASDATAAQAQQQQAQTQQLAELAHGVAMASQQSAQAQQQTLEAIAMQGQIMAQMLEALARLGRPKRMVYERDKQGNLVGAQSVDADQLGQ